MATNSRNRIAVREAFKLIKEELPNKYLFPIFEQIAEALVQDALVQKEFQGFTGNTQTSYTCGIYLNGVLDSVIISSHDSQREPLRVKLYKGEVVYLDNPYEGIPRKVVGMEDWATPYGYETSLNFLSNHKVDKKAYFALVMTTGTEYSEYLENVRNLNVLTDTYNNARSIILANIRSI